MRFLIFILFSVINMFSYSQKIDSLIRITPYYWMEVEGDSMKCVNINYSIKGMLEGKYKEVECSYRDGSKSLSYVKFRGDYNGIYKKWNVDGRLVKLYFYNQGCKTGIAANSHSNGVVSSKGIYSGICIDTIFVDTIPRESLYEKMVYTNIRERKRVKLPQKHKIWKYYSEDGFLKKEEKWDNGKLIFTKKY